MKKLILTITTLISTLAVNAQVVEGTVIINGTTYTKAVGGTVADYVDLGMRDTNGKAVLWATHNLGATTETDYGAYIAWGDKGVSEEGYVDGIKRKDGDSYYNFDNNAYNGMSDWTDYYKYTVDDHAIQGSWYTNYTFTGDNKTTLESQDDVATIAWGDNWRTPTCDEWEALNNKDYFYWLWSTPKKGYFVISKIPGYKNNSIFLPAAGYRSRMCLDCIDSVGYYWSNSVDKYNSYCAIRSYFEKGTHEAKYGCPRCSGFSLRPVCTVDAESTDIQDINTISKNQDGKYINNGHLVIVKDGKKYDAKGIEIK